MRKFVSLFSAFALALWVLPLGNFIKPSQEKTACGGGRAMHMCSMGGQVKVQAASKSSKISFTNSSGAENTQKVQSSGGNDLFSAVRTAPADELGRRLIRRDTLLIPQVFLRTPSPVPKA